LACCLRDPGARCARARFGEAGRAGYVCWLPLGLFGSSRPAIVGSRDPKYADERPGQWGDQRGGGFLGLFGRRDGQWDDRDNLARKQPVRRLTAELARRTAISFNAFGLSQSYRQGTRSGDSSLPTARQSGILT